MEELLDGLEQEHPERVLARLRPGVLLGRHLERAIPRPPTATRLVPTTFVDRWLSVGARP